MRLFDKVPEKKFSSNEYLILADVYSKALTKLKKKRKRRTTVYFLAFNFSYNAFAVS